MSVALENTIYISDKAKSKVTQLMTDAGIANDPSYFLRVGVVGGGCSGLSYKLDFDNEAKPMDQVFEDNGVKVVTDLKSFLFPMAWMEKVFILATRMQAEPVDAVKVLLCNWNDINKKPLRLNRGGFFIGYT